MIDLKALRDNPEVFKKALLKKHVDPNTVGNLVALDKEKRALQQEVERMKAKQNVESKRIPLLTSMEKEKLLKELQYIKEQLSELKPKLEKIDSELESLLIALPNPPLNSVPEGESEEDNMVLRTVGEKPEFDFKPKDHLTLGLAHDLIAIEPAAKSSGTRFYYLKNEAVLLEFALAYFVLERLTKEGFTAVIPPVLVKEKAMFGTGFFPADRNEIYHVNPDDDDLYLVGTSEVSLAMLHADEIVDEKKLPMRYAGFSTCFRREAGTYGKDVHGIFRVHQFDKVEMFSFVHPSESEKEHERILAIEEKIMQDLGFHYRVVNICGGDLGAPAAKKYDIEAWIPSQKKYRELTSCSNCTDFQARRSSIRFKHGNENMPVHTLNGTAVAIARMLVAIFENYQTEKGTIKIPKVLQPYCMGLKEIKR